MHLVNNFRLTGGTRFSGRIDRSGGHIMSIAIQKMRQIGENWGQSVLLFCMHVDDYRNPNRSCRRRFRDFSA